MPFNTESLLASGERTFGVLTKIDLMDKGTDAVDVSYLFGYIMITSYFCLFGKSIFAPSMVQL